MSSATGPAARRAAAHALLALAARVWALGVRCIGGPEALGYLRRRWRCSVCSCSVAIRASAPSRAVARRSRAPPAGAAPAAPRRARPSLAARRCAARRGPRGPRPPAARLSRSDQARITDEGASDEKDSNRIASIRPLLAAPAAAQAHVTAATERGARRRVHAARRARAQRADNASTTKVEVQFPPGFALVSPSRCRLDREGEAEQAAKPVPTTKARVTDRVDRSPGPATASRARSVPASSRTSASRCDPDEPGTSPHVQGAPDLQQRRGRALDRPPGRRRARAAGEPLPVAGRRRRATAARPTSTQDAAPPVQTEGDSGDGAPTWLAVLALVIGALGLRLAGAAALSAGAEARRLKAAARDGGRPARRPPVDASARRSRARPRRAWAACRSR